MSTSPLLWDTPRSPRLSSLCLETVEVAADPYEACRYRLGGHGVPRLMFLL